MSATDLTKNPVMHSRTKQIDMKHHFLIYHVLKEDMEITFVGTRGQLDDIFTKPLAK